MKHLRQYIRNILLESSEELRKELVKKLYGYNEYTEKEIERTGDDEGYRSVEYRKDRTHKDIRRQAKIFWNEHADHDFFENGVRKYHQLGYVGTFNPSHYFTKSASKNELSCFGGPKTSDPLSDIMTRFSRFFESLGEVTRGYFGFKTWFEVDGYTTWAGDFDAYTEELSQADEEDKERMKSSGLAKRPGRFRPMSLLDDDEILVLDEEDFIRNEKNLDEIIVDNWEVKTYWIALSKDWLRFLEWDENDPYSREYFADWMQWFPTSWRTTNKMKKVYETCIYCEKNGIPIKAIADNKIYDGSKIFKSWKRISEMKDQKILRPQKTQSFEEMMDEFEPYTS